MTSRIQVHYTGPGPRERERESTLQASSLLHLLSAGALIVMPWVFSESGSPGMQCTGGMGIVVVVPTFRYLGFIKRDPTN